MRIKGEEVDNKCRNRGNGEMAKQLKEKGDQWKLFRKDGRGFLGGPVAKTALPMQSAQV